MTSRNRQATVYLVCMAFLGLVLGVGIYLTTLDTPTERLCDSTGHCERPR